MSMPVLAEPAIRVEVAFAAGASTSTLLHLDDPTRGKLDTGTLGSGAAETPVWTDLSARFRSGTITRGSRRVDGPIVQYEPGTCSIVLGNEDRALDPSNLSGPYTEPTTTRIALATLNTNTGFESGTTGWNGYGGTLTQSSVWAINGTYSGRIVPTGVDALVYIESASGPATPGSVYRVSGWMRCDVTREVGMNANWFDSGGVYFGTSTSTQLVQAGVPAYFQWDYTAPPGTAFVTAVASMGLTPAASHVLHIDDYKVSSTTFSRTTQVTAMRAVRVLATWNGTTYELFRGFADNWDVRWMDPGDSEVTLTATDGFKVLGGITRTGGGSAGVGELTGARINRILDSASWPTADRVVAAGTATLQGTALDGVPLTELRQTADAEIGELYMDGGGRVVFRGRNDMLTETRSATSQGTFGDSGTELHYKELTSTADDATFYNQIKVTRIGGTEQIAQDAVSQALLYIKTFPSINELPLQTDAAALAYAQWLLHISVDPEVRFTSMQIEPQQDGANLFPHALGRQLGDRVTVRRRPPGGGDVIERDEFIRGIEHQIRQGEWLTRFTFSSAEKFGSFFVLDNATLGRLDFNALGY